MVRNQVKRRLREAARAVIIPTALARDFVIAARPAAAGASSAELVAELRELLARSSQV